MKMVFKCPFCGRDCTINVKVKAETSLESYRNTILSKVEIVGVEEAGGDKTDDRNPDP